MSSDKGYNHDLRDDQVSHHDQTTVELPQQQEISQLLGSEIQLIVGCFLNNLYM